MSSRPSNVSLADVARAAGVSLATASRALNNAYGVAPATRQKVLAAAREHDFVPSPEAARLAGGASARVALVVPHLDRWYFGELAVGVENGLRAAGADVLLYLVGDATDRHAFFRDLPARRKVDGVVVAAFDVDDAERERLEVMGVTIVSAGGHVSPYPYVGIDDQAAARQAVDHLVQLGHRRIAMIGAANPDQPAWPSERARSDGYRAALHSAGLAVDPSLVVTTAWGGGHGARAMARLLSLPEPPTAVFAHSDEVAVGAMRTIRRAGLRIPEDVSIVGIDDHPLADLVDLTTVHQPVREQGALAAQLLLGLLRADPEVPRSVTVPTYLVARGSTAAPPARPEGPGPGREPAQG